MGFSALSIKSERLTCPPALFLSSRPELFGEYRLLMWESYEAVTCGFAKMGKVRFLGSSYLKGEPYIRFSMNYCSLFETLSTSLVIEWTVIFIELVFSRLVLPSVGCGLLPILCTLFKLVSPPNDKSSTFFLCLIGLVGEEMESRKVSPACCLILFLWRWASSSILERSPG